MSSSQTFTEPLFPLDLIFFLPALHDSSSLISQTGNDPQPQIISDVDRK